MEFRNNEIRVVDSTMEMVKSSGEGLRPEQTPRGRLFSVMDHAEWGKASVFDVEPEEEPEPPPPVEQKSRMIRKSVISQQARPSELPNVPKAEVVPEDTDSELSDELQYWRLPFFLDFLLATILEDTITELKILAECNNVLKITKTMADIPFLLALKYNVKQLVLTDELEGIDPKNLGCLEYKLNKLGNDRKIIMEMFTKLYIELANDKTFLTVVDFVAAFEERQEYAAQLSEEEAKNRIIRKELAKQLRLQRNHHKTVAYDAEMLIASLKSQVEDAGLMTETKGRYVDNWQAARTEQHKQVIFEKESVYTDSTDYYKRRSDHESRVHAEIETLTLTVINETLQEIEDWMVKYETDTEKLDLKIQIQKSEYQNMLDKRIEMEKLYNKRDKEMRAWNKFKEEREKEREYANNMNRSAITVQAWWRGLLVRKQLGPFRKKKGKKKH